MTSVTEAGKVGGTMEQEVRNRDGTMVLVRFGVWRCMICGEIILSVDPPSECPFCGTHMNRTTMTSILADFDPATINAVAGTLTETDKTHLTASLHGEATDAAFYAAMVKNETVPDHVRAPFKRLGRMEEEHFGVFAKLLGVKKPAVEPACTATGNFLADLKASIERERGAVEEYSKYAAETTNGRLRMVWTALAQVERDHLAFETALLNTL